VAVVVLDWPERRNALGPEEARQVGAAIEEAGSLPVSGVVLTGTGAFCAGGDLEQFAQLSAETSPEEVRDHIYSEVHSVIRAIRACPVPVVAAVDGAAVGLGFDYALASDMCLIGPDGWLQQGWALAGLIHGAGGSGFLQSAVGPAFWRLVAEQERLDAHEASELRIGEATEGPALDAAVARLVALGRLPQEVLNAYTTLYRERRWPDQAFFDRCADYQSRFIGSEDFRDRANRILAQRSQSGSSGSSREGGPNARA
jgi:enoyl-CoA hydratase/carnithine racemase